jgi:two-component system cell cycle response regulator DivK
MATILLIEDAPDIRQVVELILHSAGHTVLSASDGVSGVAMAEQHRPDLVVMDLALPQLDGWEATRRLKANPVTQPIPVLACTAHVLPEDIDQALAAGCDAVIPKPFDMMAFLDQVDQLLRQRTPGQRVRSVGMGPKA